MAFVPVEFAKEGEDNRYAYSPTEAVELEFAGWYPTGEPAPPVSYISAAVQEALDDLEDELRGGVVEAGDDMAKLYALAIAGGGGGGGALEHVQSSASSEWIIPHGLGRVPHVSVWIGTEEVTTDFQIIDANTVRVAFPSPQTGKAVVS